MHEVLKRWGRLFCGHPMVQRYLANPAMSSAELEKVAVFVELYRSRLADLSWFMRCLNESIAAWRTRKMAVVLLLISAQIITAQGCG